MLLSIQVDWVSLSAADRKKPDTGEMMNETAVGTLRSIEKRLDGLIEPSRRWKSGARPIIEVPLSPAGQVEHLIQEATSFDLLSQMYMGWAPYL